MTATPNDRRLDDVDHRIVAELAADGRISNATLAERVGVAPSTALTRTRALRESGVIRGVHADIDAGALGASVQALISVHIRSGARHTIREFEEAMVALPQVLQTFFLGGTEDFVLHVAARDSDDLREFVVEHLSANRAVASTRTSLIFDHRSRPPVARP